MPPFDRALVRTLAEWKTEGLPVTSVYLDVDGRRHPRRQDILVRLDDLLREACEPGIDDRDAARSVSEDCRRIRVLVRDELDRKGVRGLALFSCSGAGLWQPVLLPQPVRDRATVGDRPHLLPLESLVEMAETFCTVIVDREKARIFVSTLGEIEEISEILDEVPGQHDQGGWSQARLQRHIEDHVQRHLKHVAEALLRLQERRPFEHVVLAGPEETVAELERELHDYVRRAVVARVALQIGAATPEVLERTMEIERHLERRREREAVARVVSEADGGTGRAVAGVSETLAALERGRVQTLVLAPRLELSGVRCPSCGHLDTEGATCAVCGTPTRPAADLVDEIVESALRQRARVETPDDAPELERLGGIGALLRF